MGNTIEEQIKEFIRIKIMEKIMSRKSNIGKKAEECIDIDKLNNAVDKIYNDYKGDGDEIYAIKNKLFYDYYLCEWIA